MVGKEIQSQLNLIDDPQKWISWLGEFDKEVDELVKIKDNDENRAVLREYVDVVIVSYTCNGQIELVREEDPPEPPTPVG